MSVFSVATIRLHLHGPASTCFFTRIVLVQKQVLQRQLVRGFGSRGRPYLLSIVMSLPVECTPVLRCLVFRHEPGNTGRGVNKSRDMSPIWVSRQWAPPSRRHVKIRSCPNVAPPIPRTWFLRRWCMRRHQNRLMRKIVSWWNCTCDDILRVRCVHVATDGCRIRKTCKLSTAACRNSAVQIPIIQHYFNTVCNTTWSCSYISWVQWHQNALSQPNALHTFFSSVPYGSCHKFRLPMLLPVKSWSRVYRVIIVSTIISRRALCHHIRKDKWLYVISCLT